MSAVATDGCWLIVDKITLTMEQTASSNFIYDVATWHRILRFPLQPKHQECSYLSIYPILSHCHGNMTGPPKHYVLTSTWACIPIYHYHFSRSCCPPKIFILHLSLDVPSKQLRICSSVFIYAEHCTVMSKVRSNTMIY